MTHELLALNAELTSVVASGKQLKKPITIPRPKEKKKATPREDAVSTDAAYKKGIGVLAQSAKGVSR